jgi:AraC-like DNA-binding protein
VINLEYADPPADLAPYVSSCYLFDTDEAGLEDFERAYIAQFRFVLRGSGEIVFNDGSRNLYYPQTIVGPRTGASRMSLLEGARVFGAGLLPAGWTALLGTPADEYANRIIDARTLFGDLVVDFTKTLHECATLADMVSAFNDLARQYADRVQTVPHWFIRAVDGWLGSKLTPDIADLEAETGLSRRQIEKLAKQIYGAPPKLLVRKYRALRTANAIVQGLGDWQDFVDEGYYDQSHCIRELKEFTGMTPVQLRDHASRTMKMTTGCAQLGAIWPRS